MIQPDRVVSTTCPYCGVGCNLHLHIKDDFIYRVTSPLDAVVNQGNLCVKGRFGYDFLYHPDRVTTPLIRRTPQQPGQRTPAFDRSEWREASWDEALDYVADRLVEIYRATGPTPGRLLLRQGHQRRQLPAAEAVPRRSSAPTTWITARGCATPAAWWRCSSRWAPPP